MAMTAEIDYRGMIESELRQLQAVADQATSSDEVARINEARWALEWVLRSDLVVCPSSAARNRQGPRPESSRPTRANPLGGVSGLDIGSQGIA